GAEGPAIHEPAVHACALTPGRPSRGTIMPTRRQFALGAAAALLAGPARAQAGYPSRPIHMLVGYPAGGGVDLVARLLGEPMKAALNGTVIVENRPGASAMIAAQAGATAAPPGHPLPAAAAGEIATHQLRSKVRMSHAPLP